MKTAYPKHRRVHGLGASAQRGVVLFISLIVLVASVMIPLGKLFALGYLLITVQRGSQVKSHERTRIYYLIEFVGRWSMLDVFVDAFIVALVQLSPLMSVEPSGVVLK